MDIIISEFKAKVFNIDELEEKLIKLNPRFVGEDKQIDTYFNVNKGRLKLREGNIENSLIHYERENIASTKQSKVILYKHSPDKALKQILLKTLGEKVVVEKKRKIYYIDNIKFHFDKVDKIGTFIEVEAIDEIGDIGIEKLNESCRYYVKYFGIKDDDFIANSYSDLILETINK